MILDRISKRSFYAASPELSQVLEFLAGIGAHNAPDSRAVLDGDRLFVNPISLTTAPESERLFEAHRNYADVHFILEGSEKIVVTAQSNLNISKPYDPDSDAEFGEYGGGTACLLEPGDFLVCYPHEAHKVGISPAEPAVVKKLVGKIRIG